MVNDLPNQPKLPETNGGRALVPSTERSARLAPSVPAGTDYDWGRYLTSIKRFKWLVLLVTLVGTSAGVVWARMAKPKYRARATVWVDVVDRRGRADPVAIASGDPLRSAARVDLVRSPAVLEPVIRSLGLHIRPTTGLDQQALIEFDVRDDFQPGSYRLDVNGETESYRLVEGPDAIMLEEGGLGDSVGTELGFAWAPDPDAFREVGSVSFRLLSIQEAMRQLSTGLRVDTSGGNFMHIDLVGGNPQEIADAVNAIAEQFVDVAIELKRRKLTEVAAILADAREQAQTNLRRAEATLNAFLVRNADRLGPGRDPNAGALFEAQVSLQGLRRDREAIERAIGVGADSGLSVVALEAIPSVRESSEMTGALEELTSKRVELRALRYRYTDENPQVQRLVDEVAHLEQRVIPDLGRILMAGLSARERDLSRQVSATASSLRALPPLAIEEGRLRREVELNEQHLATVQLRYDEARLAELSSPTDARLLDIAPPPTRPLGDSTAPLMVVVAFLASLGAGAVGAVVLDRFDPKLHYPDQVSDDLGLQIIGALPRVDHKASGMGRGAAQVVEALRGIRLNLVHAYGAAGPLMVTVTSPGSGDGKSFVSSNLALAFAESGHRTLLIDGDVRRGGLHKALGATRQPGLTDYLAGKASREEIVQSTQYPSVYFVASGTRMQTAPELLTSPAMSQFLMAARSSYGVVIVDTAPLAAGVDALALGTMSGSMLFVLRTGATDLGLTQAKLEVLDRLPVRLLGAVLNDVDTDGRARYYGYYSYYLPGYEARDEEPDKRAIAAATHPKT